MCYEFNDGLIDEERREGKKEQRKPRDSGFHEVAGVHSTPSMEHHPPSINQDRLDKLAQRIMRIKEWEWTNTEEGLEQAGIAVRLFEEALGRGVK